MKKQNLLIKVLVAFALFLICFLGLGLASQFLSYFLIRAVVAGLLTYALIQIADKIGLPGFAAPAKGKKK